MIGIKKLILSTLEKFAGAYISAPKIDSGHFLTILTYHSINYPSDILPIDEDVISCSPELFELEMKFCKKYFTPLTFFSLKKYLERQERLPTRPLIVSFDDGYKDNFTHAFPILQKYRIPATIFLTTDYIGSNKLFWWDEITYILKNYNKEELNIEIDNMRYTFKLRSYEEKRKSIRQLRKILKYRPINQREDIIKHLASMSNLTRINFNAVLSWSDVKIMSDAGIEFGSHSVTHPILNCISNEELTRELTISKKSIEWHTKKEVVAFSYPYGMDKDFHKGIEYSLKVAGYSFAVTYIEGINYFRNFNEFTMKRISADKIDLKLFKTKLAFPEVMF